MSPGMSVKSSSNSQIHMTTTTLPPSSNPPAPPGPGGTLRSNIYRAPPVVAPPQVPSHYAANYPLGHPKRGSQTSLSGYAGMPAGSSEQRGYTTLPLQISHPQHQVMQNQVPLTATDVPFRQRDFAPLSEQQIIYAENKGETWHYEIRILYRFVLDIG